MSGSTTVAHAYALGHTNEEHQRLMRQADIFRPMTRRLFLDAGIGPGMRVLDLGCGAGDVAMLVGEIVGSTGSVVGVDRDPATLALARSRADGDAHVTFLEHDLLDLRFDHEFDACVGRLILLHLADPVAAVRVAARSVRPGGILAFQDFDFSVLPPPTVPETPLLRFCGSAAEHAMRHAGMEMHMGFAYRRVFREAGIPEPELRLEAILGGGPSFVGYQLVAEVMRSLLPLIVRCGIASAEEIGVDTLADRIRDEIVAADAVMSYPPMAGAWARLPA